MSQGSKHGFPDTRLHHFPEVRLQVKLQTGTASRQNHGMYGQHHHQHQQTHHHDLCNALHTLLKTHGADSKAQEHHDDHESSHQRGIGQHTDEFTGHCLCIHAAEIPFKGFKEIKHHPSAHCCVEHHQNIVACHGDVLGQMPPASLWLQQVKRQGSAFPAGPSHCKFHDYDGKSQYQQEHQVYQHKSGPSVFAYYIREPPHIAQTNGTPCAYKDEAQPGREFFAFHLYIPRFVLYRELPAFSDSRTQ